jgi:hypothetical protein
MASARRSARVCAAAGVSDGETSVMVWFILKDDGGRERS